MKCYKLTAEHITRKRAEAVIKHAEDVMDLEVYHAGHDDVFTDLFHIVVMASNKQMKALREYMWECNGGAFCEVVENWTEEMDEEAGWL